MRMPFPLERLRRDSAIDTAPELAAFLAEAVESKRGARERLMRSIRLEHPELTQGLTMQGLTMQIPLSPCKPDSDSAPVEPLSRFVLGQLIVEAGGACAAPLEP